MIQAKQHNPSNSERFSSIGGRAGSPPPTIRHVGFARSLAFAAEKGKPIIVEAGLYRVEASDDGRIVLVSDTGEATPVPTVRDWHDQAFDAPVALDVERGESTRSSCFFQGEWRCTRPAHTGRSAPATWRGRCTT